MMNNLLSNAVKYNRNGGSVEIAVHEHNSGMGIVVSDTGIGMSKKEISQLFKEFVRIKNEKTEGIAGSGLGLSIVSKITELYGGHIQVNSIPGEGSEFKVILPV
jgi:signal transduction histidine kinase